jgi:hypothetical protein
LNRNRGERKPLDVFDLEVHPLLPTRFNFSTFDCGKEAYNQYIRKTAFEDHRDNIGKVWIFYHTGDKKEAGYVTLAMSQLNKSMHKKLEKMTGHGHIPGLLLGHMARSKVYRNRDMGLLMFSWVLNEATRLSRRIGCRLVILQADNDKVSKQYEHWGFIRIPDTKRNKNMMFYDLAQTQEPPSGY